VLFQFSQPVKRGATAVLELRDHGRRRGIIFFRTRPFRFFRREHLSARSTTQPIASAVQQLDDVGMIQPGQCLPFIAVVRRVGQGGMAGVYLAVRADGEFRQQVAIKLVRAGLDSDEVLSRFLKCLYLPAWHRPGPLRLNGRATT